MKGMWCVKREGKDGTYRRIAGAAGQRGYVQGWYDALTSFLPRPGHRLYNAKGELVESDVARKAPTVN